MGTDLLAGRMNYFLGKIDPESQVFVSFLFGLPAEVPVAAAVAGKKK
jgi:hypothetical protein